MRRIMIKTFQKENNHYKVYLGNGRSFEFSKKKETRRFLAETNRYLTGFLFSMNEIEKLLYYHWRELWISTGQARTHNKIRTHFNSLEHLLASSERRAPYKDGNYYTFIDLRKSCETALEITRTLTGITRQTDRVKRHQLQGISEQVRRAKTELQTYTHLYPSKRFAVVRMEHLVDINLHHRETA